MYKDICKYIFPILIWAFFFSAINVQADLVYPANNPENATGANNFDWQSEWGSIHINSYADGLADPGAPSSSNGKMPCSSGAICQEFGNPTASRSEYLDNGIKFDIKNSLLNCMSKPMPTWAINHSD